MLSTQDQKMHLKLAQFYELLDDQTYDENFAEQMLSSLKDNLNYRISDTRFFAPWRADCVPLSTGSTALHLALHGSNVVFNHLLDLGADFTAKDDNGSTVVHRALEIMVKRNSVLSATNKHRFFIDSVLEAHVKCNNNTNPCNSNGVSHFHAACLVNNTKAIEFFLNNGVSVNAAIGSESPIFPGYTPLHFAVEFLHVGLCKVLLKHRASWQSKNAKGLTPFHALIKKTMNLLDDGTNDIKQSEKMLKTSVKSHPDDVILALILTACNASKNTRRVAKELRVAQDWQTLMKTLRRRKNVIARLDDDSPIWPGMTPLHVLLARDGVGRYLDYDTTAVLVCLLVDFGADVTAKDVGGSTPIHLAFDAVWDNRNQMQIHSVRLQFQQLLAAQKDPSDNPVDSNGLSHFHVACFIHEVEVVEKFLKRGVDVNAMVKNHCSTPLHLALYYSSRCQSTVVDLLLRYGADVNAEDKRGETPLHMAMKFGAAIRGEMFERFVRYGANIMATNNIGKTPFELVLRSKDVSVAEVRMILKYSRYRANIFNPLTEEGYLTMIFRVFCPDVSVMRDGLLDSIVDVTDRDELGRTCLHNAASIPTAKSIELCYAYLLTILLQCSAVDCRDNLGRTALHLAARFRNYSAVYSLLVAGADVNEEDGEGRPPLACALPAASSSRRQRNCEDDRKVAVETLSRHVRKMLFCGLHVSPANERMAQHVVLSTVDISNELAEMKARTIGPGKIPLIDLMSETKVVMAYPTMFVDDRRAFQEFFDELPYSMVYRETRPLLAFQYKKAVKMRRWYRDATESMKVLVGFGLPDLCSDIILRFLIYWDVRNLIVAVRGESGLVT